MRITTKSNKKNQSIRKNNSRGETLRQGRKKSKIKRGKSNSSKNMNQTERN
jgi:hypothetical protein